MVTSCSNVKEGLDYECSHSKMLFDKWRRLDSWTAFYSMAGLILGILHFETDIHLRKIEPTESNDGRCNMKPAMESNRFNTSYSQPYRLAILITTIFAAITLTYRHIVKKEWEDEFIRNANHHSI